MRPVNLLPEGDRARSPAQQASGSYAVLGVLGALLLAVVVFVSFQNKVNSRSAEIAVAEQEARRAELRADRLGAFGSFAATKETRVKSVSDMAKARFDWERFMRELALVLPEKTYVLQVSASTGAQDASGAASPSPSPSPSSGSGASSQAGGSGADPTVKLIGCAASQPKVAVLMVRLRKLYRATDVELAESAQEEDDGSASADSAVADNTSCPPGKYKFDATVTFSTPAPGDTQAEDGRRVPAPLGGGA